jgi:hypothetical protein
MKNLASGFTSLSLLGLLSTVALADHYKDLKENITIHNKVYVNGVKVKPGRYKVRFDSATHNITLERDGDVVVTAKASVVVNSDKFDHDAILTSGTSEDSMQLTGIRLGGQREEIQLGGVASSTSSDDAAYFDGITYEELYETDMCE